MTASVSTARPQVSFVNIASILYEEISGLLAQSLLDPENTDHIVKTIVELASTSDYHAMEKTVPLLLAEEPLGQTAREQLTKAILARVLKSQITHRFIWLPDILGF
jgi:hypothetical protein